MIRKEGETDDELRIRANDYNIIKQARRAIFKAYGIRNPHSQKIYMTDAQGNRVDVGDLEESLEYVYITAVIQPINVLGRLEVLDLGGISWTVDAKL